MDGWMADLTCYCLDPRSWILDDSLMLSKICNFVSL